MALPGELQLQGDFGEFADLRHHQRDRFTAMQFREL